MTTPVLLLISIFLGGAWAQYYQEQPRHGNIRAHHSSWLPKEDEQQMGGARHHHDGSGGRAAAFDFYVLATFWPPELCHSEKTESCALPNPYWKGHLTGHGLWPNNADGTYPQFCDSSSAFNSTITDEVIGLSVMETYWPNLSKDPESSKYDDLWNHEWSKHGTCTGLDQASYFTSALTLFKTFTPAMLTDAATHHPPSPSSASSSSLLLASDVVGEDVVTLSLSELDEAFGGPQWVVLQCTGKGKYLQAAMTCWAKDTLTGGPKERMPCPAAVLKEGSCGDGSNSQDSTITIPSFYAGR